MLSNRVTVLLQTVERYARENGPRSVRKASGEGNTSPQRSQRLLKPKFALDPNAIPATMASIWPDLR